MTGSEPGGIKPEHLEGIQTERSDDVEQNTDDGGGHLIRKILVGGFSLFIFAFITLSTLFSTANLFELTIAGVVGIGAALTIYHVAAP